jgi:hypothetical protein
VLTDRFRLHNGPLKREVDRQLRAELGQLLHRSECLIAGSFQSFDVLLFTAACGQNLPFGSTMNSVLLCQFLRGSIVNAAEAMSQNRPTSRSSGLATSALRAASARRLALRYASFL